MGAIVMEASIGKECVVGAGALVGAGARIPPRRLVLGVPAKAIRRLGPREIRGLKESEDAYVGLMKRHRRATAPLLRAGERTASLRRHRLSLSSELIGGRS
jgi:carbonic anhydrase/acetyltransferase-like protein (isoleucine patch superfamily)